jgi:formate-dependent nitrite reductase cytochrome c552 subunit
MYSYHRAGNEEEWKNFPVKYQGSDSCMECHEEKVAALKKTRHGLIPCENCHGAALDHPENPEKLAIDRSRGLCLRCHAELYMPSSGRNVIPGIEDEVHNTDMECTACHNPHNPNLEEM